MSGQRLALRLDQTGPRRLLAAARTQAGHAVAAQLRHARRRGHLRLQPVEELQIVVHFLQQPAHLISRLHFLDGVAFRVVIVRHASLPPTDQVVVISPVSILQTHPASRTPLLIRAAPNSDGSAGTSRVLVGYSSDKNPECQVVDPTSQQSAAWNTSCSMSGIKSDIVGFFLRRKLIYKLTLRGAFPKSGKAPRASSYYATAFCGTGGLINFFFFKSISMSGDTQ